VDREETKEDVIYKGNYDDPGVPRIELLFSVNCSSYYTDIRAADRLYR
jgi:hypothetical protein